VLENKIRLIGVYSTLIQRHTPIQHTYYYYLECHSIRRFLCQERKEEAEKARKKAGESPPQPPPPPPPPPPPVKNPIGDPHPSLPESKAL
jgi:hypothetical protein